MLRVVWEGSEEAKTMLTVVAAGCGVEGEREGGEWRHGWAP